MAETTEPQFILRSNDSYDGREFKSRAEACRWLDRHSTDDYKIEVVTTDTVQVFGHQEQVRKAVVMNAKEFLESYSEDVHR